MSVHMAFLICHWASNSKPIQNSPHVLQFCKVGFVFFLSFLTWHLDEQISIEEMSSWSNEYPLGLLKSSSLPCHTLLHFTLGVSLDPWALPKSHSFAVLSQTSHPLSGSNSVTFGTSIIILSSANSFQREQIQCTKREWRRTPGFWFYWYRWM